MAGILVSKLGFERCTTAPQFYWSSQRLVVLELHTDDIHGAATPSGREQFFEDLAREINFKGGNGRETARRHDRHLVYTHRATMDADTHVCIDAALVYSSRCTVGSKHFWIVFAISLDLGEAICQRS